MRSVLLSAALAGNPEFEASQQYVFDRLGEGGLAPRYESFTDGGPGWQPRRGTLRLDDARGEVLLSMETHRVALAIKSHSTPGGTVYRLADAGRGANGADYDGQDVRGAMVLADAPLGTMWNHAVKALGAAGVISTAVAAYNRPSETPGVQQWGSLPVVSETTGGVGFKATPRVARRLRDRLAEGPVNVHVDVETAFHRRPNRTLIAEITGATAPPERVVLVAHVQEPGANDNASGVAADVGGDRAAESHCGRRAAAPGANDQISSKFKVQSSKGPCWISAFCNFEL